MSISAAILNTVGKSREPLTIPQINAALGGGRDYAGNVSMLVNSGKLRKVGSAGRLGTYSLATIAPAILPDQLTTSLGVPVAKSLDSYVNHSPTESAPLAEPSRDNGSDTTFQATPIAIKPAPSGRVWLETNLALKLISLALSQPSVLTDEERRLIADAIHSTSDQLP